MKLLVLPVLIKTVTGRWRDWKRLRERHKAGDGDTAQGLQAADGQRKQRQRRKQGRQGSGRGLKRKMRLGADGQRMKRKMVAMADGKSRCERRWQQLADGDEEEEIKAMVGSDEQRNSRGVDDGLERKKTTTIGLKGRQRTQRIGAAGKRVLGPTSGWQAARAAADVAAGGEGWLAATIEEESKAAVSG
ncbi:hypothetical protein GW17_00031081 [Ensete ventricosum]|nr:hypothetical protein GW17_00031081 [Ensete ventricosum]